MRLRQGEQQQINLFMKELGMPDRGKTEKRLPLADPDGHPDSGRKADNYRSRDETDHIPELCHGHQQQNDTSHKGSNLQPGQPIFE